MYVHVCMYVVYPLLLLFLKLHFYNMYNYLIITFVVKYTTMTCRKNNERRDMIPYVHIQCTCVVYYTWDIIYMGYKIVKLKFFVLLTFLI